MLHDPPGAPATPEPTPVHPLTELRQRIQAAEHTAVKLMQVYQVACRMARMKSHEKVVPLKLPGTEVHVQIDAMVAEAQIQEQLAVEQHKLNLQLAQLARSMPSLWQVQDLASKDVKL